MSWRFPVWHLFLVSFWVIQCVFLLWDLPRVLVLLSYRLSIQPFRYAFSVAIFSSKIIVFSGVWLLVCFCVLPSQLLIHFSFVVLECPVLSVLFYPLSVFLLSSFFRQKLLVYFHKLYCYFFSCCLFHSLLTYSRIFLFYHFGLFRGFFIWVSSRNSHPGFDCFIVLFEGPQFSHTLISPLHRLDHLTQICYLLICKVAFDLFCLFLFKVSTILCFLMMKGWSSQCS